MAWLIDEGQDSQLFKREDALNSDLLRIEVHHHRLSCSIEEKSETFEVFALQNQP